MISAPISSRANFLGPPLGGTASSGKLTFPKLDYDAIIETLRKIGINDVSEKDLKSPNQQIALTCFCPFVELLSYFNDEVIESMKEECLEKLDHRELYDESLHFIIRFNEIRAIMIASDVPDFTISDICRPNPLRLKKQLSAIINFLLFSEGQIKIFDKLKEDKDAFVAKRDEVAAKVAEINDELEREIAMRKKQEPEVERLREVNAKLSEKLLAVQEEQKVLKTEYDEKKKLNTEVKAKSDALKREYEGLKMDIERLKMRIENDPRQLREMNENARRRLNEIKVACSEEEAKAQVLAKKKRVLEGLEADIASCAELVKSALEEKGKLTREQQELERIRKDKADMTKERDSLAIQLEQSKQKLQFAMERLEKTQKSIEARREENKKKVESTNERWQQAQREKRLRNEEADALNKEVTKIEGEYDRITRDFDVFASGLEKQKEALDMQSRQYMQAIAERMGLQIDVM